MKVRCSRNGKDERKIPVGTPRRKWEDNITVDIGACRVGRCWLSTSGSG